MRRLLPLVAAICLAPSPGTLAGQGSIDRTPRLFEPPAAFRSAVAAGSRSLDGRPGSGYWQQEVDYRIAARLDPRTGRLEGREAMIYHNASPDTLVRIVLHLDQNVYAPGARRNRRVPVTGGMELGEVRVDGRPASTRHPGSGYTRALTLLDVLLPRALPPGDSVELELEWSFTVPPAPTFRNGNLDGEVFAVAQWYPRAAVYDDVYGWDRTPYLGDGEFYLEYGDFDVSLTLPAGWLVGATGTLRNPAEVLAPATRERLARAGKSDTTVSVVPADARGPGTATLGRAGEELTWRFEARNVRDFAFSTSNLYVWDAVRAGEGVTAQALYRPRFEAWKEAARYVAFTIRSLSDEVGPYPYPTITTAEGPVGGMEYPMMVFISGRDDARSLAGVTIHEVAHQWFPMVVGSMEAKHAWMDEGFVSYWDEVLASRLWEEEPPRWGATRRYLSVAGSEQEVPVMRHTDLVSPYGARGLAAYTKPAVVLGALRSVVGDAVFLGAFREYYRAWRYKHPQPWDFFNLVEERAGTEMDWFFHPLLFETAVLDHAVVSVDAGLEESRVVLEDQGGVVLPTPVRITLADGSVLEERVPAGRWLREGPRIELTVPGRVVEVELNPASEFPDVVPTNDRWPGR